MLKTTFNAIGFHASRRVLDEMFKSYTRPMLTMTPEARDERTAGALRVIDFIGDRCPDLAVTWASSLLFHTKSNRQLQEQAVACIAEHLPAAYALDPHAAHDAALLVHLGDHLDRGLRLWVQERFYEAAPVLRPGPWGLGPAGRQQLAADREASRSPFSRWGEQLGDLKHRVLHPPGPHDVIIPGSGWDDEPPTGPAP